MSVRVAAAAFLSLTACGSPQQLPVSVPRCDAVQLRGAVTITAQVKSNATKPITGIVFAIDFYRNFRYARVNGGATIKPELLPGGTTTVTFALPAGPAVQGRAMRCFATRIAFADGTFKEVRPSQ